MKGEMSKWDLAHDIVFMCEGRVVQRGAFDELLNSPADPFVTRFVQAQRSHLKVAA